MSLTSSPVSFASESELLPELVPGEFVISYLGNSAHSRALALGEPLFGDLAHSTETRRGRDRSLRTLVKSNLSHLRSGGAVSPREQVEEALAFCGQLRVAAGASEDEFLCEPNYVYRVSTVPANFNQVSSQLYGLSKIQAPQAWEKTTGGDVIVAVLDTGIDYTHPDLTSNMWVNQGEIPANGIDDDGNGYVDDVYGVDFANADGDPYDDHGHGTHVAGIIGAVGGNDIGVVGVNWEVQLMGLKFLSASGSGTTFFLPDAIEYAVDNGAKIINASFGGRGNSQFLQRAIAYANEAGVLVVAAAGNFGTDNDLFPHYPSNYLYPNVISVAATDAGDALGWFSNYGKSSVHMAAPGVQIFSTLPNGRYGSLSGTSMAAPHVAGAAALVFSRFSNYSGQQIKDSLLNSTNSTSSLTQKTITGGRLNVLQALDESAQPKEPVSQVRIVQFGRKPRGDRALQLGGRAFATLVGTPGAQATVSLEFDGSLIDAACEIAAETIPESGQLRLRIGRLGTGIFSLSTRVVSLVVGENIASRQVRATRPRQNSLARRARRKRIRALVREKADLLSSRVERSCAALERRVSWRAVP